MAHYRFKAKDGKGNLVTGQFEAANEQAAADNLLQRQLMPLQLESVTVRKPIEWQRLIQPRVGLEEMIIFTRQMYSLTKAGIPIIRAINGLADTTQNKRFSEVLKALSSYLEQGHGLSAAMAQHTSVFNRLTISIVHVGENTGKLEDAFAQLAEYFEREQETRKRIQAAMRYPNFVILAIIAAMFILNIFVIPTFASMFARFNTELPWATQVLLSTSAFFVKYWWLIILLMVGAVVMTKRYIESEKGRVQWDKWKLKLPVVGTVIERSLLARYARSFAMILRSGVAMTSGLSLVAEAVDNSYMEQQISEMRRTIERGESFLRASNQSGLFTPLVLQMVAVGEETGRVDELLQEVADYYEREVDYDLKSLTAKIEPILIAIVAVMVLILALGIFTPMWDMMNVYKGGRS